ncbi:hypothetical protein AJ80_08185 [Polytolypa hystricis UAMH7299]|uniref:Uncharacterized protein n=1 Tax=Polytolypa hystricis (strain UAMH7299) TaxID=1447883 RepID=A0A2B7XC54_POLH7|nr:hypothetical protein AJ80_08185 [Polytolypa hystricis UAMH7299]
MLHEAVKTVGWVWELWLVAAPVMITTIADFGIIITSTANDLLGEVIWNPVQLLAAIQERHGPSLRSRAIILNSVSTGIDMARLWPRYINVIRGGYIMTLIRLCTHAPGLVGSVNAITVPSMQGWIKLFNLTFFVGLAINFLAMLLICYIWPPPGQGESAPFVEQLSSERAIYREDIN